MLDLFSYSLVLSLSEVIMSLEIAKRIAQHIPSDSVDEINRQLGQYSLEQRKFIMSTDISGSSILFYAVSHLSSSVVKYFIDECGADPNSFGIEQVERMTCLSKAVFLNHKEMLDSLKTRCRYQRRFRR